MRACLARSIQGGMLSAVVSERTGEYVMKIDCRLGLRLMANVAAAIAIVLAFAQVAVAQQNSVTAVDIALEPDATMIQHAKAANARLLKSFPKGFTLDATHHPHVTMLQQFVRTDDLDKVFAAANAVLAKEKPKAWTLKAFNTSQTDPPFGLGIVVEPLETCIGYKMHSSKPLSHTP